MTFPQPGDTAIYLLGSEDGATEIPAVVTAADPDRGLVDLDVDAAGVIPVHGAKWWTGQYQPIRWMLGDHWSYSAPLGPAPSTVRETWAWDMPDPLESVIVAASANNPAA